MVNLALEIMEIHGETQEIEYIFFLKRIYDISWCACNYYLSFMRGTVDFN